MTRRVVTHPACTMKTNNPALREYARLEFRASMPRYIHGPLLTHLSTDTLKQPPRDQG
jgi:hypothetical protein